MEILTDGSTLVLSGDFDVRSTLEVRTAIYDLLEGSDRDVVIDMTDVTNIDITAIRVLAVATRQAVRAGRRMTLRGCCPSVRRLMHIAHLARSVDMERRIATA